MIHPAKTHSLKIRKEADQLLDETGLFKLLGNFGVVDLGGSYAYDLMVGRDLDFGVLVHSMTLDLRAKIVTTFASQAWAYSVNMTDRINFEPLSNLSAPKGLYLGLTIPFPKERWNIDVWFLVAESFPHNDVTELIKTATKEQKDAIIKIKYELLRGGRTVKGITSAEVYKAVLQHGVRDTEEFLRRSSAR